EIDAFVRHLQAGYRRTYGGYKPEYAEIIGWAGGMALENIAGSDALYHNVEHTIYVTLVGQEILRGRHLREGKVSCEDWLTFIVSLLCHDIGYVTLAQDAPVAPMNVASGMDSSWKGKELTFVGYGITNKNGAGAGVKRSVVMPIASVSATTFSYQTVGKNTCNGDSGGPAFAKLGNDWVVAGVTSYGDVGCTQYGVDTRADAYASFLAETPSSGGGAGDPCQGETYEGRCDGDTVIWCEQQSVHQQSCATQSKACGFDTAKGYYACVVADPCHGETYEGRCDGNTVIWCENEQVKQLACTSCGYDGAKGYYNCQ
ncbi:MAG: hypothetical protein DPW22_02905, partial [Alphaproteobacteria bacterium]|nr:hypothetical protein [Alphaproteobacteria bacterium]